MLGVASFIRRSTEFCNKKGPTVSAEPKLEVVKFYLHLFWLFWSVLVPIRSVL